MSFACRAVVQFEYRWKATQTRTFSLESNRNTSFYLESNRNTSFYLESNRVHGFPVGEQSRTQVFRPIDSFVAMFRKAYGCTGGPYICALESPFWIADDIVQCRAPLHFANTSTASRFCCRCLSESIWKHRKTLYLGTRVALPNRRRHSSMSRLSPSSQQSNTNTNFQFGK